MRRLHLIVALFLAASPPLLRAQDPIQTDRPGLGINPLTVPGGAFQIEAGFPHFEISGDGATETTTVRMAVLAFRYGLHDRFELRAGGSLYNNASGHSGNGDLELGVKWMAASAGPRGPIATVVGSVFLPFGDDAFTVHEDRPGYALNGVAGGTLGAATAWSAVAGVTWFPVSDEGYREQVNLVGYLGHPLSGNLSGYVETGWFPSNEGADPLFAGLGITYLVTPTWQLDASMDRGLNDDATDWIFGAGISTRF